VGVGNSQVCTIGTGTIMKYRIVAVSNLSYPLVPSETNSSVGRSVSVEFRRSWVQIQSCHVLGFYLFLSLLNLLFPCFKCYSIILYNHVGSTEYRTALILAISLGVALFICLIGSTTVVVLLIILLIKSKTKVGTRTVNTTVTLDKAQSRTTPLNSRISTRKNISYVVHSPRIESNEL
jgi:hypothetical protein